MDYVIDAVSPETRNFETKYGPMVSYKLRLEGMSQAVELAQKTTTPAPQKGDTISGTIDMSGQYGPKFKKAPKDGFSSGPAPTGNQRSSGTGTPNKNDEAIARAVALKAAVDLRQNDGSADVVLATADTFLSWLKDEKPKTDGFSKEDVDSMFGGDENPEWQ